MHNTTGTTASVKAPEHRPIHTLYGAAKIWADRLLDMVSGPPVGAVERSFKMSPQRLLANRFLIGLPRTIWNRIPLNETVARLGMPMELWSIFARDLKSANYLGLAFEEGEHGRVFKAYLEFPVLIESHVPKSAPSALLYRGLKWNPEEEAAVAVTDYLWKPRMSAQNIAECIAPHLEALERPSVRGAVGEILRLAANRKDAREFTYLEVMENGNPRNSFDLNIYAADFALCELRELLESISRDFDIPESQSAALFDSSTTDILGHISAGVDRAGRDFLTVYHDTP